MMMVITPLQLVIKLLSLFLFLPYGTLSVTKIIGLFRTRIIENTT